MHRSSNTSWYLLSSSEVIESLRTSGGSGLLEHALRDHRERYGGNTLAKGKGKSVFKKILSQFSNPLVYILVIASLFTIGLERYVDGFVILAALFINVAIGYVQEHRADKAFASLRSSESKFAHVIREGEKRRIPADEVVVGDLLFLEAGMRIPADARLIEVAGLETNESLLSGEWLSVSKTSEVLASVVPIFEQQNMVFSGTVVTSGIGKAIVVAVGTQTEMGKIGTLLSSEADVHTPLEKEVRELANFIATAVLFAIILIFSLGVFRGESFLDMTFVAIAIAVAAIPEGLPAAVTVVLAIGMESILRRGGLVRNLLAAETLGTTTVILTDKTGTLTKAEMQVGDLITETSFHSGHSREFSSPTPQRKDQDALDLITMGMLASDAFVEGEKDALKDWVVRGRPVERAVVLAGLESGLHPKEVFRDFIRTDFIPFGSLHRFAASLHRVKGSHSHFVYLSGAPEFLLQKSRFIHLNGKSVEKTKDHEREFERAHRDKSKEGMRLIGVAYLEGAWNKFPKEIRMNPALLLREKTVFVGFIALHDPVRDDVPVSVEEARRGGARVIMVTGDHPDTARAIAHVSGILDGHDHPVYTGADIEGMSDREILLLLRSQRVFARMLPEHKLRLARVLEASGEVVAMTGDGVNDAPALRGANIGVALGSGMEVAKEASDLILLNNSFTVLVAAIEEGRRILDNLRKIITYLLSTSFGEIILFSGALLGGYPLPLLPAQMIWTNMVTEGLMNFAFAFEPKEPDVMRRSPKSLGLKSLLPREIKRFIFGISGVTGLLLLGLFFFFLQTGLPQDVIQTLMFVTVSGISLLVAFSVKDLRSPLWLSPWLTNKYLWLSMGISFCAMLLALFTPFFRSVLGLVRPTSDLPWGMVFAALFLNLLFVEFLKFIFIERRLAK